MTTVDRLPIHRRVTAYTPPENIGDNGNGNNQSSTVSVKRERPTYNDSHYVFDAFKSINIIETRDAESRQIDPFWDRYTGYGLIPPLWSPEVISRVMSMSETLRQSVECMVTNIHLQGYEFEFVPPVDNPTIEPTPQDLAEKDLIHQLFTRPNSLLDFKTLRKRLGKEYYSAMSAYWEIVRNVSGVIAEIYHVPGKSIRMTAPSATPVEHTEGFRLASGEWISRPRLTRFRRFAQLTPTGHPVWFKQFGDPRQLDYRDGEFKEGVPLKYQASEILHFCDYSPDSPYGEPIWGSEAIKMAGASKAHSVNYLYFQNNIIPPMVVTVAGGVLTSNSLSQIKQMIEQRRRGGVEAYHKVWVLEAIPESRDASGVEEGRESAVRIKIEPMTQFMQSDAQFIEYTKNAANTVKRKYRLPDILLGDSKDFNRATAKTALQTANQQVFAPERRAFDDFIERTIFADMGIQSWRLKSLGPKTTNEDDALESLAPYINALTIGQIQELFSSMTGMPSAPIDESVRNTLYGQFQSGFGMGESSDGDVTVLEPEQELEPEPAEKFFDSLLKIRERTKKRIAEVSK